jgi:hypothetical protein
VASHDSPRRKKQTWVLDMKLDYIQNHSPAYTTVTHSVVLPTLYAVNGKTAHTLEHSLVQSLWFDTSRHSTSLPHRLLALGVQNCFGAKITWLNIWERFMGFGVDKNKDWARWVVPWVWSGN